MKIAVLGSGSFGCTIAQVLSDNNHEILLWTFDSKEKENLEKTRKTPFIDSVYLDESIIITDDLNNIKDYEIIVYVVPSFAFRDVATKVKLLNCNHIHVICTKGIEADSMKTGYDIIHDDLQFTDPIVILSGPTHAEELAMRKFTTIVSTSDDEQARIVIQKVFSNGYLRVYTQSDIVGVELLGGAKNVLAIAAGVCDSYPSLGDNAKAALLTRGLAELVVLGQLLGAQPNTFYGLTGMGDLIVTATSKHSRNRKFGELLGKGYSVEEALDQMNMVVEGLYSVKGLYDLTQKYNVTLPIIESMYKALYLDAEFEEVLEEMFKRELKDES